MMAHWGMLGTALAMAGLGAALGGIGGLLGIGGGLLAIPVLALWFGMDQSMAQGTALVMIVPNVLLAFYRYRQHHTIPLSRALGLGGIAMLASYPAARLAVGLDHHTLQWVFIGFLLGLCAYLCWLVARPPLAHAPQPRVLSARYLPVVGVVSGVFSGLFTVGGGLVATPMLVRGFGHRQAAAQGLALALVVPGSLIALSAYASAGQVSWSLGLPMALGGLSTISWGVACARRLPERWLRSVFIGFLLVTTALMWPARPHRRGWRWRRFFGPERGTG